MQIGVKVTQASHPLHLRPCHITALPLETALQCITHPLAGHGQDVGPSVSNTLVVPVGHSLLAAIKRDCAHAHIDGVTYL